MMGGLVSPIPTDQVAEEISRPLTSANKITLVSSGSGTIGAAKVTGEVLDILSRLPESVERLTGISISQVRVCVWVGEWVRARARYLTHVIRKAGCLAGVQKPRKSR